jgi:DUF971 family protein
MSIQEKFASDAAGTKLWPTDIRYNKSERKLHITFENGETVVLTAEKLRVESPSAEVQGHHAGQKIIVTGKENVQIAGIEPVGNYAVRLIFDDGHETGIYTWNYLKKLSGS